MKKIRIISLGDIITPKIEEAIKFFCKLIAEKKPTLAENEIKSAITTVIRENKNKIEDFKTGKLAEKKFTEGMISALHQKTNVTLTLTEFNLAWFAMQPSFEEYSVLLQKAVDYHTSPEHELIFISATNPKDITKITSELAANQFAYKKQDGEIIEIAGIPLYTTYGSKQTKAKLIRSVIDQKSRKPTGSLSTLFKPQETTPADIKYIISSNLISNPTLKTQLEYQNDEIKKMLLETEVLDLNESKQSLAELFNEPHASASAEQSPQFKTFR